MQINCPCPYCAYAGRVHTVELNIGRLLGSRKTATKTASSQNNLKTANSTKQLKNSKQH